MRLRYFAWVREKIGAEEEQVSPPASVRDVAGLIAWLRERGPRYADALRDEGVVRVAVNQRFARPTDPVAAGDEIALFPPVTGG